MAHTFQYLKTNITIFSHDIFVNKKEVIVKGIREMSPCDVKKILNIKIS